jgi:hypothetical protein
MLLIGEVRVGLSRLAPPRTRVTSILDSRTDSVLMIVTAARPTLLHIGEQTGSASATVLVFAGAGVATGGP